MDKSGAKDLFQLQTELIDMKVDMAVGKAIDRVIDQITGLRNELHVEMGGLRNDMDRRFSSLDKRFSSLENRTIAVETKLGMVNETQKEIRTKFIAYSFKALWLLLGTFGIYAVTQLHLFLK